MWHLVVGVGAVPGAPGQRGGIDRFAHLETEPTLKGSPAWYGCGRGATCGGPVEYAASVKEENQQLINRFYQAFPQPDAPGMNACYARDIRSRDPRFGSLAGDRV